MNDHELDRALGSIGADRTRVTTPVALRQRVHAVPFETPARRSWLPRLDRERFRLMFNATKVVVAGVIVALFGGFLLTDLLPTGDGGRQLPAPGATASASATEAPATSLDTTVPTLLPGVELDVEMVRPGIYRVLSDGHEDLTRNVWDVQAAADGSIWIETHRTSYVGGTVNEERNRPRFEDITVRQLGVPSAAYEVEEPVKNLAPELKATDGHPTLELWGTPELVWDGADWIERVPTAGCQGVVDADGGCWTSLWLTDPTRGARIAREDPDGTSVTYAASDLGLAPDAWFGSVMGIAPDGTVWVDIKDDRYDVDPSSGFLAFGGLAAFDGGEWTVVRPDEDFRARTSTSLDVAPDGTVWVTTLKSAEQETDTIVFHTWDGTSWATVGPVERPSAWRAMAPGFAPDGAVWLDPLTRFDGAAVRRTAIPALSANLDPQVRDFSYAGDGSAWVVVTDPRTPEELGCDRDPSKCEGAVDGLYVITPGAFGDGE